MHHHTNRFLVATELGSDAILSVDQVLQYALLASRDQASAIEATNVMEGDRMQYNIPPPCTWP